MEKHPKKKLLDQVRDVIRLKHYSIRTEKAYVNWIRVIFCFITNATLQRWEAAKSRLFSHTSL